MRIDSCSIGMESARSYKASSVTTRRFSIRDYQQGLEQNSTTLGTEVDGNEEGQQKSEKASGNNMVTTEEIYNQMGITGRNISMRTDSANTVNDIRQITLRYIFDMLFAARRGRLNDWMKENGYGAAESTDTLWGNPVSGTEVLQLLPANSNVRVLNYSQETWYEEEEQTSFATTGTVKTADGREISFNVNVEMSRRFREYYREDLDYLEYTMCDPLVINLNTDVAEFADQNFYFDIDADGEKDEIASLGSGSGYLALDHNNDGIINDGKELFGTSSGNGFADLAAYDDDGNGWIDEGDKVWSKLKIWCKDEEGKDVLYKLSDKGVGAICLQSADTDFSMRGDAGRMQGAIRKTGIFLYENGNVGTVQHVDMAKYQKEA